MANGRNPGAARRPHATKMFPKQLVGLSIDSDLKSGIRALAEGLQEKVLRSGVYAGARIMYMDMLLRTPIDDGTLVDSIYHWHDDKRSTPTRQIYAIGPNKAKAPHWHLVEYGHWRVNKVYRDSKTGNLITTKERLPSPIWVPAYPYIRPAFDGKITTALAAMKTRMAERMQEVVREIAA